MAVYTATIANGGTYYQPHIVRSLHNVTIGKTYPVHSDSKQLPINYKHFKVVKEGMWSVVNAGGTGAGVAISGLNVCGKTGTAQNPAGADHS
jgi:penicillin-binding protein 2